MATRELSIPSPIGLIAVTVTDKGVSSLAFREPDPGAADVQTADGLAESVRETISDYLDGKLEGIAALPLDTAGTDFESEVWREVARIPPGETASYGSIANAIGRPGSARAVGAANGKNPVALLVPCHRVIGANGTLTGYAYGVWRKRWLLEHETRHATATSRSSATVNGAAQISLAL